MLLVTEVLTFIAQLRRNDMTRREQTIVEWRIQIQKKLKDIDNGFWCFTEGGDIEDVKYMIECGEKLIETLKNTKKAMEYMDKNGIK